MSECPSCNRPLWDREKEITLDVCEYQGNSTCRLTVHLNNVCVALESVLLITDERCGEYRTPLEQMTLRTAGAILEYNRKPRV